MHSAPDQRCLLGLVWFGSEHWPHCGLIGWYCNLQQHCVGWTSACGSCRADAAGDDDYLPVREPILSKASCNVDIISRHHVLFGKLKVSSIIACTYLPPSLSPTEVVSMEIRYIGIELKTFQLLQSTHCIIITSTDWSTTEWRGNNLLAARLWTHHHHTHTGLPTIEMSWVYKCIKNTYFIRCWK